MGQRQSAGTAGEWYHQLHRWAEGAGQSPERLWGAKAAGRQVAGSAGEWCQLAPAAGTNKVCKGRCRAGHWRRAVGQSSGAEYALLTRQAAGAQDVCQG